MGYHGDGRSQGDSRGPSLPRIARENVMAHSQRLRLNEVRQLFHLIGETIEQWDDPDRWRNHFLTGLCELLGGGRVGWSHVETRLEPPGESDLLGPAPAWVAGWDDAQDRRVFVAGIDAINSDPGCIPTMAPMIAQLASRPLVTARRRDLVADKPWHRTRFYEQYCAPCGWDRFIVSAALLPADGALSIFAIGRHGNVPLQRRHCRLVQLAHREIAPLIGTRLIAPGQNGRAGLTRRQREVLDHLLTGRAEKEIAHQLCISPATIHDHVLAIYRHYHVNSRAGLMARWIRAPRN
jgi:DNA-binding CsgD family transcriptional regulator